MLRVIPRTYSIQLCRPGTDKVLGQVEVSVVGDSAIMTSLFGPGMLEALAIEFPDILLKLRCSVLQGFMSKAAARATRVTCARYGLDCSIAESPVWVRLGSAEYEKFLVEVRMRGD